ncbi:hypothetical protein HGA64_00425 [Candidatus Falkowbacteria bacterium]|nr:hypothetical protein [Candidatus Falkowbacteria bacterium]
MNIAIKVGSNLLVGSGVECVGVNKEFIYSLCTQIAILRGMGHNVLLITSGAVASDGASHRSRNLRAAVGWLRLLDKYSECFFNQGILEVAPILITDHELHHPEVFIATVMEAFNEEVQIILNANDPVNNKESNNLAKCEDNDRLTAGTAIILKLDLVMFGIDRPGLMDDSGAVVQKVCLSEKETILGYAKGGSKHGFSEEGMRTKLEQMFRLAEHGIDAMLVPARENYAFVRALKFLTEKKGELSIGTLFTH